MKILFLAHRIPYPPDKGDKIRSYHILSYLAERHDVSLVYWFDDPDDGRHANILKKICKGKVTSIPLNAISARLRGFVSLCLGKSFSEGYFFSRRFQRKVDELLKRENYDLVYVFSSPMAQYVRDYRHVPTLLDFVDVDSEKWGGLADFHGFPLGVFYRLEKNRLAKYELEASAWARWSLFVSQSEADLFRSIGGKGNIAAIANGADSDLLRLPIREAASRSETSRMFSQDLKPAKLVFVGTMNYFPNSDAVLYFIHEVLPLIRKNEPAVTFDVIGRFPTPALRKLHGRNGVRVLGAVRDIRPYLIHADVSVAPLRIARGIQNKILEAMAVGLPVVATKNAVEGIDARDEEEILIADSPASFAGQVTRLLQDAQLRYRIGRKARARILQSYSWKGRGLELERLIAQPAGLITSTSRDLSGKSVERV